MSHEGIMLFLIQSARKGYSQNEKNTVHLPRQYLQKPDGGVCDERYGKKSGAYVRI